MKNEKNKKELTKKIVIVVLILIILIVLMLCVYNYISTNQTADTVGTDSTENIVTTNEGENVLVAELAEEEDKPWEWQHDTLENQNINRSAIESVHESLNSYPINAEVIVRNGVMADEYYKEGYDENSVFTLQSTSKSVTSALIGIAIDKGYIESVDVPLSTYFPQILESGSEYKNQLTIWHLLTHAMDIYDMAKFGQLYLNNGVWEGEQIISPEWIEQSTTLQFDRSSGSADYGYQWWVRTFGEQNYPAYFAQGHFGQYIFVVPDLELVVAFTSHYEGSTSIYWEYMNQIVNARQ